MVRKKACDSCHTKKIHCDGAEPQCEWCAHRDLICTYQYSAQKRPTITEAVDQQKNLDVEIEQRLFRLEELLGDIDPKIVQPFDHEAQGPDYQSTSTKPQISFGGLHFVGRDLGTISSQTGIPVFSEEGLRWIQTRTGAERLFDQVYKGSIGDWEASDLFLSWSNIDKALPAKETAVSCLTIFRSSHLRRIFPLVDVTTFEKTISQAYDATACDNLAAHQGARTCVLAFMAAVFMIETEKAPFGFEKASKYAMLARSSLLDCMTEPTVHGLQAALMLCLYYEWLGNIKYASIVHSLAVRCMYNLGAHVHHELPSQSTTRAHIRDLFWLCYFWDKHISLRTGQPSSINDSECDLCLSEYTTMGSSDNSTIPLFPSDLHLTIIKSKVSTMLYSPPALHMPDSELLRVVRELDNELEEWRLSIPPFIRPQLSVSSVDTAKKLLHQEHGMLIIFIHLEYFYLLSAIHRACGRCSALSHEPTWPAAVRSSYALSVQASRSTLIYVQVAYRHMHRGAFWVTIYYPLWATVTVFCNILHDPNTTLAQNDMEILKSVPHILKELRVAPNTSRECCLHQMLDAFIEELVRLAHCALSQRL